MAYTVRNVTIEVEGTQLVARWQWDDPNYHTQEFSVRWWYMTELETWYLLDEQTVDRDVRNSRVAIQEDAVKMWVVIKPISKTYKNSKGNEVSYFTSDWSTRVIKWLTPNPPEPPSSLTADLVIGEPSMLHLVASGISTDTDNYKAYVIFQVVDVDPVEGKSYTTEKTRIPVVVDSASYNVHVDPGHQYKIRCQLVERNNKAKEDRYWYERESEWSDYYPSEGYYYTVPKSISFSVEAVKETDQWWANVRWNSPDPYLPARFGYKLRYADDINKLQYASTSTELTYEPGSDESQHCRALVGPLSYSSAANNEFFFKMCATNDKGASDWSDIHAITIGEPPVAPTTWSSNETASIGEDIMLYWTHNSKDNSKMYLAELEIKSNDEVLIHGLIPPESQDETVHHFRLTTSGWSEGRTVQWRVRTSGATKEYGEWSITREIRIYEEPTLTVSVGDSDETYDGTIEEYPIMINASARPNAQSVIGYHFAIVASESYEIEDSVGNVVKIEAGSTVYSKYIDSNVENDFIFSIGAMDIALENNVQYVLKAEAVMNSGLSAFASAGFLTAWGESSLSPDAEIGIDESLVSVNVRPYCVDSDGDLIPNVLLSVYRVSYDGEFIPIAQNIENDGRTFVVDPHPSLNYARYRIIAISSLTGAMSYYDLPSYPIGEKAIVIQWDDQEATFLSEGSYNLEPQSSPNSILRLPYNIDVSDKNDMDVALVEYIGRKHPVSYYGTQIGSSATWNVEIDKKDVETLYALRRLASWQGNVYVREPSGSGYWAHVSVSFSQVHRQLTIPVTLDLVRVEGGA